MSGRGAIERILAALHDVALGFFCWPITAALIDGALGTYSSTGPVKRVATAAVVMLVLAAVPSEGLGAQCIDGTPPELSASHGAAVEPITPYDERTWKTPTPRSRHRLQFAQLKLDGGKLGEAASRAVSRWPAAKAADPAWEWVRALIFLVQLALVEQGYDPGRPDGVMGPNTMMALIAWHAKSGKPMEIGIVAAVAYLLHATLEEKGLEPGPRERILARQSKTALKRWDDTFKLGTLLAYVNGPNVSLTRSMVEADLERTRSSSSGETTNPTAEEKPRDHSAITGYVNYECLKISWNEHTPICDRYVVLEEGKCRWVIEANNKCGHDVIVHLLVDRKDGNGPRWVPDVAGASGHVIEAGWERATHFSSWTKMDLPEHVKPDVRFCVHKWDPDVRRFYDQFRDRTVKDRYRRWYRNDFRDGRDSGEVTRNLSGDFAPNTTCLDTY